MKTVLSNGVDLASLSRAELLALVAQLPARAKSSAGKPLPACIASPHTGACTRCGAVGAAGCDPQAPVQFVPGSPLHTNVTPRSSVPTPRVAHVKSVECYLIDGGTECTVHGARRFVTYMRANKYMGADECAMSA